MLSLAIQLDGLKALAESRGLTATHPIVGALHSARCELMGPDPNTAFIRAILKRLIRGD